MIHKLFPRLSPVRLEIGKSGQGEKTTTATEMPCHSLKKEEGKHAGIQSQESS